MLEVGRFSSATRSLDTCPTELEASSPLGRWEVHEPLCDWDVAHDLCFDARHEVSRLELCIDAVQTALAASERETVDAWAAVADA